MARLTVLYANYFYIFYNNFTVTQNFLLFIDPEYCAFMKRKQKQNAIYPQNEKKILSK